MSAAQGLIVETALEIAVLAVRLSRRGRRVGTAFVDRRDRGARIARDSNWRGLVHTHLLCHRGRREQRNDADTRQNQLQVRFHVSVSFQNIGSIPLATMSRWEITNVIAPLSRWAEPKGSKDDGSAGLPCPARGCRADSTGLNRLP